MDKNDFNATLHNNEELDYTKFHNYIASAIPFFLISMTLELAISLYTKRKVYRFNDAMNSMSLGLVQEIVNIFIKPLNYIPYLYIWKNYSIIQLGPESWVTWWVALLGIDFGYYWFHRFGHQLNIGWATHVPHHSSDDYNLSTALRQGSIQYLFGWLFYLPLAFICHPLVYSFHSYFNRLFQFWVHTQIIRRIGILEHILVTPSHHRVHHGSNPEYLDKNYGGVFIIWDKLFGTFEQERAEVQYGITTGLHSWSPIWGNMHYFAHMYEMSKHLHGLSKLQVLYKGPDWSPIIAAKAAEKKNASYVKYDAGSDISSRAWVFALLQLAFTVVIRRGLEDHFSSLNSLSQIFFATAVMWGLVSIGHLLQKTLTLQQELARISITSAMLLFGVWQVGGPLVPLGGAVVAWAITSLLLLPPTSSNIPRKASRTSSKTE